MAQVKRVSLFACILAFVFLFAAMPPHAAGAADGEAENLSKLCKYDGDFSVHADRLKDDDFDTAQIFPFLGEDLIECFGQFICVSRNFRISILI